MDRERLEDFLRTTDAVLDDQTQPSPVTLEVVLAALLRAPRRGLVDDLLHEVRTQPPTPPAEDPMGALQRWYREMEGARRVMLAHPDRVEEIRTALADTGLAGRFDVRPCEYLDRGSVIVGPRLDGHHGFMLTGE